MGTTLLCLEQLGFHLFQFCRRIHKITRSWTDHDKYRTSKLGYCCPDHPGEWCQPSCRIIQAQLYTVGTGASRNKSCFSIESCDLQSRGHCYITLGAQSNLFGASAEQTAYSNPSCRL